MRFGETMAVAAERELEEETGLRGRCGRLVGWAERISDSGHFVIADFDIDVPADQQAVAGSDATEVAWVPVSEVATWPLVSGLWEFLVDAGVTTVDRPGSPSGGSA